MAFLKIIFSAVLNSIFKLFGTSPEQKLGRLEVTDKIQEETIHEMQVDKAVSDRIDGLSDDQLDGLSGKLNIRP